MNREIKFRGLDISGKWYYGNLSVLKEKIDSIEPGSYISNKVGLPFAYPVRPETVGQYTGLLDKNNEEIYEGDILSENYPSNSIYICEFRINHSISGFYMKHYKNIYDFGGKSNLFLTVVGNIHENNKLLYAKP